MARLLAVLGFLLIGQVQAQTLYQPSMVAGAPDGLVSGGTRGADSHLVVKALPLTDDVLKWSNSETLYYPVELTLIKAQAIDPSFEIRVNPPIDPGVYSVEGVQLERGIEYEWYVSVVIDENQRSTDIVSRALVGL